MAYDRPSANELRNTLRRRGLPARQERLTFLRSAAVPGTEVLTAFDSFYLWRVFNERYAICACRTAATDWRYRGGMHYLRDASCMLLQAGEAHANTRVHKYSDFKVLFLEPFLVADAARELGFAQAPQFKLAQTEHPLLFTAVYAFCAAVEENADALEQQSRLTVCLRRMLHFMEEQRPVFNGRAKRAVRLAADHLRQRLQETVTLDELVAVSGLSRFHLLRSFAGEMGLPPHAYQIRLRIDHAMRLLREGSSPSVVAHLLGFADQSHLTRHFRRIMRTTPGEYLRATSDTVRSGAMANRVRPR